jgi:glucokinase
MKILKNLCMCLALVAILEEFLAGQVNAGRSRLTNLSWTVDQDSIRSVCGARAVFLVNDLQAMAYSVPFLSPENLATLRRWPGGPSGHRNDFEQGPFCLTA